MKKSLLSIIALFLVASVFAQAPERVIENPSKLEPLKIDFYNQTLKNTNLKAKKVFYQAWFNFPIALANTFASDRSLFHIPIFPDSTVKVTYGTATGGTELGYVSYHSAGEVFDPKSTIFELNGGQSFSEYDEYKWDSLFVPYFYHRRIDSFAQDTIRTYNDSIAVNFRVNGMEMDSVWFINKTAWTYSYDTITQTKDSSALPSFTLTHYDINAADPFAVTKTETVWPVYYMIDFDTSGNRIDSTMVTPTGKLNKKTKTIKILEKIEYANWHQVRDRVVFQFFDDQRLTKNQWLDIQPNGDTLRRPMAYPSFNGTTSRSGNFLKEHTVYLTANDTFTDYGRGGAVGLKVPIETTISAGKICGFTMTFYPDYPYSIGDTLDLRDIKNPKTPTNMFEFMMLRDNTGYDVETYNNGIFAFRWQKYRTGSSNTWFTRYIPGNGWINNQFTYVNAAFLVSTETLGQKEIFANDNSVKVYPNPVAEGQNLRLTLDLNTNENVTVELFNLVGQKVKTLYSSRVNLGELNLNLSTSGLKPGFYLLSTTIGNEVKTQRVSIVK